MIYDYASGQYQEIRELPVDDGKNVVEHGGPLSHRRPICLRARHRGLRRELRNLSNWRNSLLQHMEIISHDIDLCERGRFHSLQTFPYAMRDTPRELQSETRLEGAHVDELYNILSAILQLSTICEAKAADTEGCRKQAEKCLLEQLDNPRKILHGSTKMVSQGRRDPKSHVSQGRVSKSRRGRPDLSVDFAKRLKLSEGMSKQSDMTQAVAEEQEDVMEV